MSKDAELETAELSGYRDKVSVSRVSKKSKMRQEALDPYSLNFHCCFRVSNSSLVFVFWFFFGFIFPLINAVLCTSKHQLVAEMSER